MPLPRSQAVQLLLLVAVVAGGVQVWRSYVAPTEAGAAAPARARTATARATPTGAVADVRLDRLHAPRAQPGSSERNPFRFESRPAPVTREPELPVFAPVTAAPSGPPAPPPIPLKFIGVLDAPERIGRVAILSDSRGDVFYGKEGDIIDGRYQVLTIGAESAELAYTDGRGRQMLRLSGQ